MVRIQNLVVWKRVWHNHRIQSVFQTYNFKKKLCWPLKCLQIFHCNESGILQLVTIEEHESEKHIHKSEEGPKTSGTHYQRTQVTETWSNNIVERKETNCRGPELYYFYVGDFFFPKSHDKA